MGGRRPDRSQENMGEFDDFIRVKEKNKLRREKSAIL